MSTETTIKILSIDAWADGGDDEGSPNWTWNNWHKVGECPLTLCDAGETAIIAYMIEHGYLNDKARTNAYVEDDQYNMVIVDKKDNCPLFALEYGSIET